jgi:type II secretory ATPase GspE/PulE/Tfp pilus assembly ATPase PilB-like protein/CheY-like chemotaxis protein
MNAIEKVSPSAARSDRDTVASAPNGQAANDRAPAGRRRIEADRRLVAFLVRAKKLDAAAAHEVERAAASEDRSVVQVLAARGLIGEEDLAAAIATGLRVPLLAIDDALFEDDVLAYVRDDTAVRCALLPVRKDGEALLVAMANPFDQEAIRAIEFTTGIRVRVAAAARSRVLSVIEQRYKPDQALRSLLRDIPDANVKVVRTDDGQFDIRSITEEAGDAPVVKIVNLCLNDALARGASDVHIEPGPNIMQVRFRVNGVLEDVLEVPKWAQNSVIARLKIMAKLDITERRIPQDGNLRVRCGEKQIDLRVSSLPTPYGEKIVIRVLNPDSGVRALDRIGLSDRDFTVVRQMAETPEGIILVTGPTGSGKTTTLYSMLKTIHSPEINIVTVEDPIEYHIAGITQVHVNEKQGLTFASALRSLLRQDPDVILVGEIRDRETAQIAFQAAHTGHLVLSTVHTNDAASTLTRLLELGVERHVLASSLIGVVAQRLVRTVCPFAGAEKAHGKDCPACRGSGFAGRTGIYEVLRMTPAIVREIENKASETTLRALAVADGTTLLRTDALAKIAAGITTNEEAARVVQIEDAVPRCPTCDHEVEDRFSVCPYCLGALKQNCPGCNAVLRPEWKTCPFCGPTVASAAPAAPSVQQEPRPASNGSIEVPRVLIVDDTEDIRSMVRMTIERAIAPVRCIEAANGIEALGLVEMEKPHAIVLDVMMPGLDGFEFCKRLRAKVETALIPVIMLTACTDAESKEVGFLAGTDDYLTKPFQRPELVARVRRLLERTYGWAAPAAQTLHS